MSAADAMFPRDPDETWAAVVWDAGWIIAGIIVAVSTVWAVTR